MVRENLTNRKHRVKPLIVGNNTISNRTVGEPSAALEIQDIDGGFLTSRMTTTQRDEINDPADGLLIWNSTDGVHQIYLETEWLSMNPVPRFMNINEPVATPYVLALSDQSGAYVRMNFAGSNQIIIPLNSTVAFPVGTAITVSQMGAGETTITSLAGVTINGTDAHTVTLSGQNTGVTLIQTATDAWDILGSFS